VRPWWVACRECGSTNIDVHDDVIEHGEQVDIVACRTCDHVGRFRDGEPIRSPQLPESP
jgi:hypothetical protein